MTATVMSGTPGVAFGPGRAGCLEVRWRPDAAGVVPRLVRASVFTAAGVCLALAAHLLGGGPAPQTRSLALAAVLLWLAAVSLTGRERGGRLLGATMVVTQLAMHALFAFTPRTGDLPSTGAGSTAIWARLLFCHDGPGSVTAAQVDAAKAGLGIAPGQLPPGGVASGAGGGVGFGRLLLTLAESWPVIGMLAAHLAAAGAMAWWLRRGERAAWAAGRRIVRAIVVRIVPRPDRAAPHDLVARQCTRYLDRRCVRLWASAVGERAPPAVI